jgi:hypothetical protein
MISLRDSVTAYPIKDDALQTGELDYINGGIKLKQVSKKNSVIVFGEKHFQHSMELTSLPLFQLH